uniref:Uncharacterized protein n=1 Tax=Fagus sylvatica TaxID=28930 RepID=A0A2N9I6J4_FAGSY
MAHGLTPSVLTGAPHGSRPLGSHFSLSTSHFSDLTPPELQTVDLSLTKSDSQICTPNR